MTVEAEPDKAGFGMIQSMAKTTVEPVRGLSSPTRESKRRGRSNSGSKKLGNRTKPAGKPNRNGVQSTEIDMGRLTDLDTSFLEEAERSQVRPKRKAGVRQSRKACQLDGVSADQDNLPCVSKPGIIDGVLQSSSNRDENETADSQTEFLQEGPSPELPALDFNRVCVRSRGASSRTAGPKMGEQCSDHGKTSLTAAFPAAKPSTALHASNRQVSAATEITYPTPDNSVQDEMEANGSVNDSTEEHAGFDTILESEGFTMIDLESLPSARHCVTSPANSQRGQAEPSANIERTRSTQQAGMVSYPLLAPPPPLKVVLSPKNVSMTNRPPPTPIPSYLEPPEEGESDLSSTVPSSPPADLPQQIFTRRSMPPARSPLRQSHTPLASTQSSPKLPSPPNQPQKDRELACSESSKSSPPRLARVVRAGIALQGLLSPVRRAPSLEPSPIPKIADVGKRSVSTPKERLDDLFVGFDSGTRRELRAGLRLGEELAKRQRPSSPQPSCAGQGGETVLHQQDRQENDMAWRGEILVRNSPVQSTEPQAYRSSPRGRCSISASPKLPSAESCATPLVGYQSVKSVRIMDAEAHERRWQLERDAVSRQVENAKASQVIVVDSDEDDEKDTDDRDAFTTQSSPAKSAISEAEEDIWLAEAKDAQLSTRQAEEDLFPQEEQVRQRERACEVVSKPRRSLIPSPWKRGENVDGSFTTNGDMSGIFWQRPEKKQNGRSLHSLQSHNESRKGLKETFDVDKMIGGTLAQGKVRPTAGKGPRIQALKSALEHDADEMVFSSEQVEASEHESHPAVLEEEEEGPGSDASTGFSSGIVEQTWEESSVSPQPMMIPVKFNDTTDLSNQSETRPQRPTETESSPSSPCRPVTPRSAMKGSRAKLTVLAESVSPSLRKVVFSRQSLCLDGSGNETSVQVWRDTISLGSSTSSAEKHLSEIHLSDVETGCRENGRAKGQTIELAPAAEIAAKPASTSWFSRLTSWGLQTAPNPGTIPAPTETPQWQLQKSSIQLDPAETAPSPTKAPACTTGSASFQSAAHASDPRMPPPPETMAVSGYFSDYHYKHLHILWLKSLTPKFTRPGSIRPGLEKQIGKQIYSGDGEFAWEITSRDAEVVERWFRSFEGREDREIVEDWRDGEGMYRKIGWDEWHLCMCLFGIVVGQELRKEDRERKEKDAAKGKGKGKGK